MDEVPTAMMTGFSFEKQNARMATSPLFLARGLGIDRIGSGLMNAGGDGGGGGGDRCYGGGDQSDIEGYYKRMIDENPSNAVYLKNYAQFLYQKKGDIQRAEEYYSRAILLDPGDGEIMSQYAKLVWELHGDEERATNYFERAIQAAPQDSHVLASYAGFLWEAEDEDCVGELGDGKLHDYVESFQHGTLACAT